MSEQPEYREFRSGPIRRAESGGSTVDITCPFCSATVKAYLWSLAGSGKRCTCGALHTSTGQTRAPKAGGRRG